jgi:hypothetical protein
MIGERTELEAVQVLVMRCLALVTYQWSGVHCTPTTPSS